MLLKSTALTDNKFRKIGRFILLALLGFSALIGCISSFLYFQAYLENDRVSIQNQLEEVRLGWTKDEVLFRKGNPEYVTKRDANEILKYKNGQLIIYIENGKVEWVTRSCDDFFGNVSGISCGDTIERLNQLFDKANNISISSDKLSKIFCFKKYNICYQAELGRINSFILSAGDINFLSPEDIKRYDEQNKPAPINVVPPEDLHENKKKSSKASASKDPCEPDLSKSERLERMKAFGPLRQSGTDTYESGGHMVMFSSLTPDNIVYCQ
jgi:hypothetical protein